VPYSYANALHDALADALAARNALTDQLGTPAFYSGVATPAARNRVMSGDGTIPTAYIVFGSSFEGTQYWFGRAGTVSQEQLHIWTDQFTGKKKALDIYAEMAEVLNNPIALSGGLVLRGTLNLITVVPDDSGMMDGWCEYRADITNA
jgi:hypothetical protein